MRNYEDNVIVKMTFEFALSIVEFTDLLREKRRFSLADQLFRSGCSIGANVREAQGAESKADFVHKLKIALKEAEETEYWLELCRHSKLLNESSRLIPGIESVIKVLNKIIATTKNKMKPSAN